MKLQKESTLPPGEILGIYYHNFFGFPLKKSELKKWTVGKKYKKCSLEKIRVHKSGDYYFVEGGEKTISSRKKRELVSKSKFEIAKKGADTLSKIPTIKFVGVTGSLAMESADTFSDVDLMIITKKNTLWITRAISFATFSFLGIPLRRSGTRKEKDKLCLNIWIDESNLSWENKNIFTAHEIAQVIPLLNKNNTYERFIKENLWVKNYWPNIYQEKTCRKGEEKKNFCLLDLLFCALETPAYFFQKLYMRKKITNEKVKKNLALFHPNDLSRKIVGDFEAFLK